MFFFFFFLVDISIYLESIENELLTPLPLLLLPPPFEFADLIFLSDFLPYWITLSSKVVYISFNLSPLNLYQECHVLVFDALF